MKNRIIELGRYKEIITKALFKDDNVRSLIVNNDGLTKKEQLDIFKKHVKSHLFIDDTITDESTYIFYDIRCPKFGTTIKDVVVIMYVICHRETLDDISIDGFYGNRVDILSEMVTDAIVENEYVSNQFGIGELDLSGIDIYNSKRFYGRILTFSVPNFR